MIDIGLFEIKKKICDCKTLSLNSNGEQFLLQIENFNNFGLDQITNKILF